MKAGLTDTIFGDETRLVLIWALLQWKHIFICLIHFFIFQFDSFLWLSKFGKECVPAETSAR